MRANLASLENRGIEFSVNAYPIRTNNFTWNSTELVENDNLFIVLLAGCCRKAAGQWYGYNNMGVMNRSAMRMQRIILRV